MDIRLPIVREMTMSNIRVILVDDHEMVRMGLKSF